MGKQKSMLYHGIRVPYYVQKRKHGGAAYIFECATDGCGSVKEISASKNLPVEIPCQKVEEAGWAGRGHAAPGIARQYYCPKCQESKTDGGEVANEVHVPQVSQYEGNVVDQLPRTACKMRVAATNNNKSKSFIARIPREILERLGNPNAGCFEKNNGSIVLNFSSLSAKTKLNYGQTGNYVELRMGSSKLPFDIPGAGGAVEVDFFVNEQTRRLISTTTNQHIYNLLTQKEVGSVSRETQPQPEPAEPAEEAAEYGEPPTVEAQASVKTDGDISQVPQPPSHDGLTVDDGEALKAMLNEWLDACESMGFQPVLVTENNRISRIKLFRDI